MFLLPAMVGRGGEGTGGNQAGHVAFGGGSLRHLCPNAVMLGASSSGTAVSVPVSPGHPSGLFLLPVLQLLAPRGGYLGKTSVPTCCGGAGRSSRHAGNPAWGGGPRPGPTTAHAGGSGAAGAAPLCCLLEPPSIPVDVHGQALPHPSPPHPPLINFFFFLPPP